MSAAPARALRDLRVVISSETGLNARAAAMLIKVEQGFDAQLFLESHGQQINARSIMQILSLEACKGTEVTVMAEGPEAIEMTHAVEKLFANGFIATDAPPPAKRKCSPGLAAGLAQMKNWKSLVRPLYWAISTGQMPEDIARQLQQSLDVFKEDTVQFDSEHLKGQAKHAELVVKLGFWLVRGQLQEHEFRFWVDCIPPEDNAGWDVDLLNSGPGSVLHPLLKMGPIFSSPEACLIQESRSPIPLEISICE